MFFFITGKSGLAALVKRAKEFSGESQPTSTQEGANSSQPQAATNKKSGFMSKMKNFMGLSNEPITSNGDFFIVIGVDVVVLGFNLLTL